MSRQVRSSNCCIPGCARLAVDDGVRPPGEGLCDVHWLVASPRLRTRLQSALRRCERLENVWSDVQRYDAVVETGRYLKLCDATQAVMDQTDSAWTRVKLDILLNEANRPARAVPLSGNGQSVAQAG